MRKSEANALDLMLFPELGPSAYAVDDLLLQDVILDRGSRSLRRNVPSEGAPSADSHSMGNHT